MTEPPLLRVEHLRAGYGFLCVVWDVSLVVHPGEWVVVLGPNGAGKTTLFRALAGVRTNGLRVSAGKVLVRDRPLVPLDAYYRVRAGIAYVPEGRHVFPGLTVQENLELAGAVCLDRRERQRAMEEVFHLLPVLAERRRQLAGTLSGGEQQMLAIGRALMQRPALLILDEPSQGLAPKVVLALYEFLARLQEGGVTLLMAEQNVRETLRLASRAYVLDHGRVVREGSREALMEDEAVRRAFLGV
ncbi:MAG: ABC transporter ATP-binding protein [Armatimonadetes bacterium]|nr:ABC transporter ATP-binding protein [Armatimonadota bacterium]MDW8153909.1 ABC transporter ATP-binding protein [Armatimonadota bacterium]